MNLKDIFELMDKFDASGLHEIEVKNAESSVSMKKPDPAPLMQAPAYQAVPAYQAAPVPVPAQQGSSAPNASAQEPSSDGLERVNSPIVGTFFRSAAPDTPPFAQEGSVIENGASLCIIEAMKVMNRLEAEFKLEVVKILVNNGDMVEYGTPLFEVKRL